MLSRPTSLLEHVRWTAVAVRGLHLLPDRLPSEPAQTSKTPSLEAGKDNNRSEEEIMEAKGEERSRPTTLPPPSSSSSSCSSEEVEVKEEKERDRGKDGGGGGGGGDDDDGGYHTPTSPRHRIPKVGRCPPAPRKPTPLLRRAKRKKVRAGQAGRRVDDVEGEIGSLWSAELADAGPTTKKARGEAANA